ncbi:TRAP transporter small permease [Thalassococcus sp. CAU 1522]|uniref:TRAP transporter small permease protein n=1 Tax=Thalassococcus arenae TaxID=2851652 RepID=A0ABS6NAY7_9RHOB|nr:TRAP transporter small permease [Thalassococcus arenae]MBV2361191.1 TRAP transporter small permease [Thalassococcus arenae]
MAQDLLSTLRRVNRVVALLVGVLLMGCVAFVLADIVLRQLGSSLGGTDEISGYVMAIATAWGMGYTLLELGHVRIDLLRSRAPAPGRALFDLAAMLALAGTVTLIAIRGWPVLSRSLANSSRANTPLETPLALVQAPWLAGWAWFAVMAWLTFVAAVILVLRGDFKASEATIGTFGELDALK